MKTAWAGDSGLVGSLPASRHCAGTAVMGGTTAVVVVAGASEVVVDDDEVLDSVVVLVVTVVLVDVVAVVVVVVVSGAGSSSMDPWMSRRITITAMTARTAAATHSRLSAGGRSGG